MPKKAARRTGGKKKIAKGNRCDVPPHNPHNQLLSCLGQLSSWLNLYQKQLIATLADYGQSDPDFALWEDFTVCLKTMRAPVTESNLTLLKLLLDHNNSGLVKVASLYSDLLTHHHHLTQEKVSCESRVCSTCGLRLPPPLYSDPCPSYVELHMTLAPFASSPSHPRHMTFFLQTSTTIHAVQHQLHSSLGAMATAVAIFSEEVGVVGSGKTTPTMATLFYDYVPVTVHCPVLNSDHYYRHLPQISTTTR